jgi:hypothetical protein
VAHACVTMGTLIYSSPCRFNGGKFLDSSITTALMTPPPMSVTARRHLLQAVDYGLLALGEIPRETIYDHIHKTHGVLRDEIPEKLESFHRALRAVLGTGTTVIENLIAKNFYRSLGLNFREQNSWTLLDYVGNASGDDTASSSICLETGTDPAFSRPAPGTSSSSSCKPTGNTGDARTRNQYGPMSTATSDRVQPEPRKRLTSVTSAVYTFPSTSTRPWRVPK